MSYGFTTRTKLTGAIDGLVSHWARRQLVKSVQRGTITLAAVTSNTATITAVSTNNALLANLGTSLAGSGVTNPQVNNVILTFTNATTITATRTTGTGTVVVSYEVVEYFPGVLKSVQRGTIALTAVTSNTATITTVDTTRTLDTQLGVLADSNDAPDAFYARLALTNATTLTASIGAASIGTITVGYQVAEYY